jgi:hypothetical protein
MLDRFYFPLICVAGIAGVVAMVLTIATDGVL